MSSGMCAGRAVFSFRFDRESRVADIGLERRQDSLATCRGKSSEMKDVLPKLMRTPGFGSVLQGFPRAT